MRRLRWLRLQMRDSWLSFHSAADWPQAGRERERLYRSTISHCKLLSHLLFTSSWPPFPASFTARSAWFALFPFPPTPSPDILVPYFPHCGSVYSWLGSGPAPGFEEKALGARAGGCELGGMPLLILPFSLRGQATTTLSLPSAFHHHP